MSSITKLETTTKTTYISTSKEPSDSSFTICKIVVFALHTFAILGSLSLYCFAKPAIGMRFGGPILMGSFISSVIFCAILCPKASEDDSGMRSRPTLSVHIPSSPPFSPILRPSYPMNDAPLFGSKTSPNVSHIPHPPRSSFGNVSTVPHPVVSHKKYLPPTKNTQNYPSYGSPNISSIPPPVTKTQQNIPPTKKNTPLFGSF